MKKPNSDQLLFEYFTSHQVDVERIKVPLQKKVLKLLNKVEKEIRIEVLKSNPTAVRTRKMQQLQREIKDITGNYFADISGTTTNYLKEFATIEAAKTISIVNKALSTDLMTTTLNAKQLEALVSKEYIQGSVMTSWFDRLETRTINKITDSINFAVVNGEPVNNIARRIVKDQITTIKRDAEAIVRTSIQQVQNAAREELFKANSDVIKGYTFSAVLDFRTTQQCRGYDGLSWTLEGEPIGGHAIRKPTIPVHWNCRSTWIPITKSFEELLGSEFAGIDKKLEKSKQRVSITGEINSGMTYEQWLKKQPISKQKEVLGLGKYNLYKKEKLTFRQMIDQSGNPLTLKELKAKS